MLPKFEIVNLWKNEFRYYNVRKFRADLTAGLTVAAVALPLALAFGIAGGATAAAGLVTAVIAGFVIAALGGAPYQISGPTGAMSAVLIVIVQKYGLQGLWIATLLAGLIILALGIFKLGRVINFVPIPVITGFTSGIALIIFVGQIDNFAGIKTPAADNTTSKIIGYFSQPLPALNFAALAAGGIAILTMIVLPKIKWTAKAPAALIGISLATLLAWLAGWNVAVIGNIPATIILEDHYNFRLDDLNKITDLLGPATAIAALGAIESLLAGLVAGRMTNVKLNANQELIAQGVGNLILPFVGGVPATAAIARMSVGVRAGGITRMVSFIHAAALLLSALFLSPLIARIPLAALSGVLMVTAFRMNEWHLIKLYFRRGMKAPIAKFIVTMLATITFDLTQAIIIGIVLSLLIFIAQISNPDIVITQVNWERFAKAGYPVPPERPQMWVVYVSGPLYFGAAGLFSERLTELEECAVLILSMRGVPVIDTTGLHTIEQLWEEQLKHNGNLYITGLQPQVEGMLKRYGLVDRIGQDHFFWSADQAILAAAGELRGQQLSAGK